MSRKFLHPLLATSLVGVALLFLATSALAQAVPDARASEGPDPQADAEKVIREQSIYIPYEKLRKVFEQEGRGVFLPYERFRELWEAAREKTRPPAEIRPPVGALITEVDNDAVADKEVVRVTAVVKIEVLAKGWSEVPLRLADAAITAATLDGQPARIVPDGAAGYKLLVEKKGDAPEQIELTLQYAKAITRTPGRNSVSFQAPQAPVSRWRVRIPEPGVKVDLHPLIAASEVPSPEANAPDEAEKPAPDEAEKPAPDEAEKPAPDEAEKPAPSDQTVVLAFVGAAPEVRIDWTPKAEGALGLEALASVQAEQQVFVSEGVTRTRTQLAYAIRRAELASLGIEVPADHKVAGVFDANVKQWKVEPARDRQTITVQLFEPAKGTQNVTVELEKFAEGDQPQSTLQVPVVKALDVGRQQGVVVVQVGSGLRAETTQVSGLLQVDAAELPETFRRGDWAFSYRYAAVPYQLELSLQKVLPRILVDTLVEAEFRPKRLSLDVLAIYTVERAGVFRLEWDVPAGYEVLEVHGREAAGAAPVQVDTHPLEGADKSRLIVNLARKATGRVALALKLEKELDERDLQSATGKKVDMALPLPQPAPETVDRASGRVILYAAENLLVNTVEDEPEGFRAITTQAALEGMEPAPGRDASQVRPVKAYAYAEKPAPLELTAECRKPEVRVRQLLVARIGHGAVDYEATFFYDVLYSSVNSLRIDLPEAVAAEARNISPKIEKKELVLGPADVPEVPKGYVAWSFTGDVELIGPQKIRLVWKQPIGEQTDARKPVEVVLPRLMPRNVELPWGQIVLTKAETIDLRTSGEPTGLRPIDPQHDLMPDAQVAEAAAAFEFHDDWSLAVAATRYELEEVQPTSIERAVLRMVVTRADKISVQALYRMRSVQQRLAVRLPQKSEFDVAPRIDGRPVPLEAEPGQKGQYWVPLIGQDPDQPFLLELRYTVTGDGRLLDRPVFPLRADNDEGPAAKKQGAATPAEEASAGSPGATQPAEVATQAMYVCVYLPQELDLIHKRGPWSEQFRWWLSDTLQFEPVCRPSDQQLLPWVSPDQDLSESFPTDGRLYVFSALRPAAPPQGSLHLTMVKATRLSLWVIVLLVLAGVLATPLSAGKRVLAVGAFVVAFVLCGVFFPLVIWQICDGLLAAAVVLIAVIWIVWYVVYTLPRVRARRRAARPQPPPPGVPPGATPGAPPGPPPVTAPTAPTAPQSPSEVPGKPGAQGPAQAAPQPPAKPEAGAPPRPEGNPFGRQSSPPEEGGPTDE